MPQRAPIWPSWLGQMATVSRNFSTSASRCGGGNNRTDAVAGQAVGFGKRIKMDQRVGPIGIGEQIMRRAGTAVKIAVGFIDDQGKVVGAGKIAEGGKRFGGVFGTAGVVGADQNNGLRARRDQGGGVVCIRDQASAAGQGHGA